jgi:hypothetical protein
MIAFDPRTETQEELDRIAIEADCRLERMSFGQFRMRADGLYLADDKKSLRIAGPERGRTFLKVPRPGHAVVGR